MTAPPILIAPIQSSRVLPRFNDVGYAAMHLSQLPAIIYPCLRNSHLMI